MTTSNKIRILEHLCRTCMLEQQTDVMPTDTGQKVTPFISLYDEHETKDSGNIRILELLKQTSPKLTVENDDMLPKNICGNCLDMLVNIHEFQKTSVKIEQRLRSIIKQNCTLDEIDGDPLNDNSIQQDEGGEDFKIETDEPLIDATTSNKGFFTLLQKDGEIIEMFNALEECNGKKRCYNEKCNADIGAKESNINENDNQSYLKYYIRGDSQRSIVDKEQNGNDPGNVNDEVNAYPNRRKRNRKCLDKRTSKDIKEVAKAESPESEVSECMNDESELEIPTDKSVRFKPEAKKNINKLKDHKNEDQKAAFVKADIRGFPCSKCEKRLKTRPSLKMHLIRHLKKEQKQRNVENGHICPECGARLKTRVTFRRHLMMHEKDESKIKYKCQFCNKVFSQAGALRYHARMHTGERPYLCSICGKSFATQYNLKQHYGRHGTELKYQCPKCPKRFRCPSSMSTHKATVHTTARPYVCDVCGASFKKPYSLTKHKIIHGERKHKCDYCEMKFAQVDQCRRHMRTHTGEKPYKCRYCERAYAQSNDMIKHMRVHLGENVYRCEMCPQAFRLLSEKRAHFALHIDDDEETKSKNLQALKDEDKRIQSKIESEKVSEQHS